MESRRIFVEKKPAFRVEAESLRKEFNENLSVDIRSLRLVNLYDLTGFSDALLEKCRGIALLGGWETSMGASLLVEKARRMKHDEIDMTWIGKVERHG